MTDANTLTPSDDGFMAAVNEMDGLYAAPLAITSAPDRIWLDLGFNPYEDNVHFDNLHDLTWSQDNATGYGIEYVRADRAARGATQASECGNCFEGETDRGHACRKCGGTGVAQAAPVGMEPVARIEGIDEYGPRLEWTQHWVDVGVGAKLFTESQVQAMLAAAAAPSGTAREPLSQERLQFLSGEYEDIPEEGVAFRDGWRSAEMHHGITAAQKGGKHGTE